MQLPALDGYLVHELSLLQLGFAFPSPENGYYNSEYRHTLSRHLKSLLPPFLGATVSLPSKLKPVKPTAPPSLLALYLRNASLR